MRSSKTHFFLMWNDISCWFDWKDEARHRAAIAFLETLLAPHMLPREGDPYPAYMVETPEQYSAISDFYKQSGLGREERGLGDR